MAEKTWHLIAPDWARLDTIWHSPQPFVLWSICEKPLLTWWLDEAVRQGIASVRIEAVDRPHLLRRWLDARDLWSRSIEVDSTVRENSEGECFFLDRLPNMPELEEVKTPVELLQRWYVLQVESLRRRSSAMVHLDHEYQPGVWFGPGASAAPGAIFTPPCWVGSMARIGSGCRVGPQAFIGAGAFLDTDVEIEEAIVCAETYVGSHTSLKHVAVQGGLLMDLDRGIAVEITDEFMLASLQRTPSTSWTERLLAALFVLPLEILAKILAKGKHPEKKDIRIGRTYLTELTTYPTGPLLLRRASWLRLVVAGRMRLIGVLPRSAAEWNDLPPDAHSALEEAIPGVFALSDLYNCHSPERPEEWIHALFQVGTADGAGQKMARRSFFKIAFTTPIES